MVRLLPGDAVVGSWRHTLRVGVLAAVASCMPDALTAQAPDEAWRTLETEHFRVSFPLELEEVARRAGERAERAHVGLVRLLDFEPEGTIDLVVTDHVDFSNGFANVTPWMRMTVFVRPPVDDETLQYFDDWLELVITHELAHIFHLNRAGPLGRLGRRLFGRLGASWPLFPARAQPQWVVEGLATLYESELTDAGRVHSSEHDMFLRVAALEGELESLDRASGRAPNWPTDRAYVYGSRFLEHVTDEHGDQAIPDFVEAVSRQWIPYRINAAARDAMGASISESWSDWMAQVQEGARQDSERLRRQGRLTETEPVGTGRRQSLWPRVSPDGRLLAYARSDGRSDANITLVDLGTGAETKLIRTNGTATLAWAPEGIVFSQLDYLDPYRIRNDLYEVTLEGRVRRLTHDARVSHPTVSPDGSLTLAVQSDRGGNRIVRVDRRTGETEPWSPGGLAELWSAPRISPDGRWVAAARWQPGARMDIVVLDIEGRVVTEVTADRARDDAPTWSADGQWLVWASDVTGIPNILGARFDGVSGQVSEVRQLTRTTRGFRYPSLGGAGEWVYFSGYETDGWRIERARFDPSPALGDVAEREGTGSAAAEGFTDEVTDAIGPYRSIRTLGPQAWEPRYTAPLDLVGTRVLGRRIGLETKGEDVVGRHAWNLLLRYEPSGGRVSGAADYEFRGLGRPILRLGVSQGYGASRFREELEDSTFVNLFSIDRSQRVDADVELQRRRWRSFSFLRLSGAWVQRKRDLLDADLTPSTQFALRVDEENFIETAATLFWSNARRFAFSVSAEEGANVLLRVRRRSAVAWPDSLANLAGVDGSLDDAIARVRAYKGLDFGGWGDHVIAFQAAGGVSRGPGADDLHFVLGDASGVTEDITGFSLFGGSPRLFPLRGYPRGVRAGARAWSFSAEYRAPLWEVRRGWGSLPIYLDRVSASGFFDAGNAWGPNEGPFANLREQTLSAVGIELVSDWVPFWDSVLRVRSGVGVPLVSGLGTQWYVRVGTNF